jgi:hypothetical protein
MESPTKSRLTTGVMLILLGLALYSLRQFGGVGRSIVLIGCGAVFVAGYLYTRAYMLLVTGCIVFGLGFGNLGKAKAYFLGDFTFVGLGIGFILIWLIALLYQRRSHWWPLVPGVILILLGFETWGRVWRYLFSDGWPLILVIVGALIVLGALGRSRKPAPPAGQPGS